MWRECFKEGLLRVSTTTIPIGCRVGRLPGFEFWRNIYCFGPRFFCWQDRESVARKNWLTCVGPFLSSVTTSQMWTWDLFWRLCQPDWETALPLLPLEKN